MKKLIHNKYFIIILFLAMISVLIAIYFKSTTGVIMGVKINKNIDINQKITKPIEEKLGVYNKFRSYSGYDAYIINNKSNYNTLKVFDSELKYPNYLILDEFRTTSDGKKVIEFSSNKDNEDLTFLLSTKKKPKDFNIQNDFYDSKTGFERIKDMDTSSKIEGNKFTIKTKASKENLGTGLSVVERKNELLILMVFWKNNKVSVQNDMNNIINSFKSYD